MLPTFFFVTVKGHSLFAIRLWLFAALGCVVDTDTLIACLFLFFLFFFPSNTFPPPPPPPPRFFVSFAAKRRKGTPAIPLRTFPWGSTPKQRRAFVYPGTDVLATLLVHFPLIACSPFTEVSHPPQSVGTDLRAPGPAFYLLFAPFTNAFAPILRGSWYTREVI